MKPNQSLLLRIIFIATSLFSALFAHGSDQSNTVSYKGFENLVFNESEMMFLAQNGFYIDSSRNSKNICNLYVGSKEPQFLTADAILYSYHRLINDSIKRGSYHEFIYLKLFLHNIYALIEDRKDLENDYPDEISFIKRYIGVALVLLDDDVDFYDESLSADVADIVHMLNKAEECDVSESLQLRVPGIEGMDFPNAKPVSFYAETPKLSNYFRAVMWLRGIVFKSDNELMLNSYTLLAALGYELNEDNIEVSPIVKYYGTSYFLGVEYHCGIEDSLLCGIGGLDDALSSRDLFDKGKKYVSKRADKEGNLYFLASQNVMDNALFKDILKEYKETNDSAFNVPASGLLWLAYLGSDWAKDVMTSSGQNLLLQFINDRSELKNRNWIADSNLRGRARFSAQMEIDRERKKVEVYLDEDSLYGRYVDVISALLLDPDQGAPDWMFRRSWERKMNETVLSSWAQKRHSLSLFIPREILIGCSIDIDDYRAVGFVSPYPVFYERMDSLIKYSMGVFSGASFRPELYCYKSIDDLKCFLNGANDSSIDFYEISDCLSDLKEGNPLDLGSVKNALQEIESLVGDKLRFMNYYGWERVRDDDSDIGIDAKLRILKNLDEVQLEIEKRYVSSRCYDPGNDIYNRWNAFSDMISRAKYMCQKQLRGIEWNEDEVEFFDTLSSRIAYICDIHDDVESAYIAGIGQDEGGQMKFHVGTGRWRTLWVLYPWERKLYLCRGAFLPYFEFFYPTWLQDSEWRRMEPTFEQPDWLIDQD